MDDYIKKIPWDSKTFGIDTYEVKVASKNVLLRTKEMSGHFTIKVDPLFDKSILIENGFYYCDTLVEPYCKKDQLKVFEKKGVTITQKMEHSQLAVMADNVFVYSRFYRDFNINKELANLRFLNWLEQLYLQGKVFGLAYKNEIAGFFAYESNKILLHSLNKDYKGRGLAKYFWYEGCKKLFSFGHEELLSSISISNLAVLNLYISLGFKFRNAVDVYHKINKY